MANTTPKAPARRGRQWLCLAVSVAVLATVVLLLFETEDTADVTRTAAPPPAPAVSVIAVSPGPARAVVSAYAELRPRWDAELRSAVSGRILSVHAGALAGSRAAEGTSLFSIEKTRYKTAVAAAELSLEQARLSLLQARNKVTVAQRQFARDGASPPNDLALHLPQLRIAERNVAAAKAQLQTAQRDLADCEVTAPFSGFVTRRLASLGQTVNAGDPLLQLADDRQFEITAGLSQEDWKLLQQPVTGQMADLYHRNGQPLGQARIRQGGGFLDQKTRQMRIFLEITDPQQAVLAGDFLRVAFRGRELSNTLTLPEGTLTRAGHIWLVDGAGLLQRITPRVLFRHGGNITIAAPDGTGPWQVARTPLASFLPGQRVSPKPADG
ncbi:efflux RND transporter periplasmic adaptor subunit [Leisingera sp. JC11]|uniref:efflux RND transporter periplasmic adaptor subunit n=1 Tax=Leisingera sp. JC11 TaxID=3042469 RepID=UPI003456CB49